MKRLNIVRVLAFALLSASLAYGQATRTWVSGVGDDANPCSRTAPCKTFAGAISKTAPSGEIDALDPGGFGALTITKAITLDGGGGQVASVLVAGTNGIVVAAGAGDFVIIRNMRLDGLQGSGNAGLSGIRFISGKTLNIENSNIFGFSVNCIDIAVNQNTSAIVHVVNSVTANCGNDGIKATNAQTPAVQVGIDHTQVMGTGANGIEAAQHSHLVVSNSFVEHAVTSGMVSGDLASNDAVMTIDHSDSSFNINGVATTQGGTLAVGDSKIAFNTACGYSSGSTNTSLFAFTAGGQGTNRLISNTLDSCGTVSAIAQK